MPVKALTQYALLQALGWAVVLLVVAVLLRWGWVNTTAAGIFLVLWLLKDVLLFPLYRAALGVGVPASSGVEGMVGRRGVCRTEVNGRGMIEVQGEHWLARSADGVRIAPGSRVHVVGHDGLLLQVRAV